MRLLFGVQAALSVLSISNDYINYSLLVSDKLTQALIEDHSSFTRTHQLRIAVGTWNVNGGKTFQSIAHKQEKITDWLLDLGYNMKMNESG